MEFFNHLLPETQRSLHLMDISLNIVHSALILFLIFGALFKRLVPLHFTIVIIVWISWLGFGFYVHQLGYCLITDWHWQVKAREGQVHLPASYITYLVERVIKLPVNNQAVVYATGGGMLLITLFSSIRFIEWRKKRGTILEK